MKIKSEIKNELFNRQEFVLEVESEINPGFEEMRKKISEKLKKPEEVIEVYNIKGSFGSKTFEIYAHVYDSNEDLEKSVQKTKKQRDEEKKVADEAYKATKELISAGPAVEVPTEEAPAPAEQPALAEETPAPAEQLAEEAPVEEKKEEAPAEDSQQ
jgi:ribosomal protein S24E